MIELTLMVYKKAILGGTFDHFHRGHRHFIGSALDKCEFLIIGLTVDEFSKDKPFPNSIEPYSLREKNVLEFLSERGFESKTQIIAINDPFGTSLTDNTIDSIFVTDHGLANANLINNKRNAAGMTELHIERVPFLLDRSGEIISSTRIRAGEIDREGNVYSDLFSKTIFLPESLREEVKILGEIHKSIEETENELKNAPLVISVGDVVSKELIDIRKQANISIIDGRVQRENISIPEKLSIPTLEAKNSPGAIDSQAASLIKQAIQNALSENQIIKIDGEEDLLTIPAIMLAPLNSLAIYGLPNQGIVVVKITEEKKKEIEKLILRFTPQANK